MEPGGTGLRAISGVQWRRLESKLHAESRGRRLLRESDRITGYIDQFWGNSHTQSALGFAIVWLQPRQPAAAAGRRVQRHRGVASATWGDPLSLCIRGAELLCLCFRRV